MKQKLLLTLLAVCLSVASSFAQLSKTVNVSTSGTLATLLGADKTKVTDLTLTGTINDADFQAIKEMTALKNLNMSAVNIINGTIPGGAFYGRALDVLTLPVSVKIIGPNAFEGIKTSQLDFSKLINLETIYWGAFKNANLT
ncbi:MAG: hypothetical protein RL662_703, partial [Bacteroidota bacterium]